NLKMRRKRDENEEDSIEERAKKKMLELNQDRKFFDFKFTVEGDLFHVNKMVLSAISPYFAKKFEAEWKSETSVNLEYEHSVEPFSAMIEYIYTYRYEQRTDWHFGSDTLGLANFHFELYHMAEEYKIPGLKELVLEDLPSAVRALDYGWAIYKLADSDYISDSELRKAFVGAVADNVHDMEAFEDEELDKVKGYLAKTPIFAADLVYELIDRRIKYCRCRI
ncbi:hypothetical protein CFD26_100482, partial [Aspergillus turcosus]